MAYGALPTPGTKYGPCEGDCEHRDCAQSRRMAAQDCAVCGQPIGWETAFYQRDNWATLIHVACEDEDRQA